MECGVVTQWSVLFLLLLRFVCLLNKRLGSPGIMKAHDFRRAALISYIVKD